MRGFRINENMFVDNAEKATFYLQKLTGDNRLYIENLAGGIYRDLKKIIYFDDRMCRKEPGELGISYAWLDTGYTDKGCERIYLSLYYDDGSFCGHYVGNAGFLAGKMMERHPWDETAIRENLFRFYEWIENEHTAGKNSMKVSIELLNDVRSRLLIDNWRSVKGLAEYLCNVGTVIPEYIRKDMTEYFYPDWNGNVVVNSGLIDQEAEDIYIGYIKREIAFLPENVAKRCEGDRELKPVKLYDEKMARLDITEQNEREMSEGIRNIVEKGRNEFSDRMRKYPDRYIEEKIRKSLEIGLKIHRREGNYAKPVLIPGTGRMSWMLPVNVGRDCGEPELVMLIGRRESEFKLKKIVRYDDAIKDRVSATNLYSSLW